MEINPADYKILLVDDIISNVLLLKILLAKENYNIITASNGKQALEKVAEEHPDLVFLDVLMPDINGFEVAKRIRMNVDTADIPIIFLTALNDVSDIMNGFQIGGNEYISKPFDKDELLIRVKHQISLVAAKRLVVKYEEEFHSASAVTRDLRSSLESVKGTLDILVGNLPTEKIGAENRELLEKAGQTTEDAFALLEKLPKEK